MFRLSPSGLNDFPMLGIPLYALFGCCRRDKSCASILRRNHWPMSRRCQPFPSSDRKPSCVDAPATLKLPLSNSDHRVKRFRVPGPSMRRIDEGVPASGVRSSRPRCLLSAVPDIGSRYVCGGSCEVRPGIGDHARSGRGQQDVQRDWGAVVTADAMYTQRDASELIIIGKGRQALAVEGCTLSGRSGEAFHKGATGGGSVLVKTTRTATSRAMPVVPTAENRAA